MLPVIPGLNHHSSRMSLDDMVLKAAADAEPYLLKRDGIFIFTCRLTKSGGHNYQISCHYREIKIDCQIV